MPQTPDYSQLIQLMQSPAGQQLISMLRRTGGSDLQEAIAKAASGDYAQAQKTISSLLDTPEAKKLLEQLGGGK